MMTCDDARAMLGRVADADAAATDLAGHLAACAECRAEADGQRVVSGILAGRPATAVPAGFAARVMARVETDRGWLGALDFRRWTYRLAPVAVGLLLVSWLGARPAASEMPVEFGELVDAWAAADNADEIPMYTLFREADVSGQDLLEAVLAAAPDEERWR